MLELFIFASLSSFAPYSKILTISALFLIWIKKAYELKFNYNLKFNKYSLFLFISLLVTLLFCSLNTDNKIDSLYLIEFTLWLIIYAFYSTTNFDINKICSKTRLNRLLIFISFINLFLNILSSYQRPSLFHTFNMIYISMITISYLTSYLLTFSCNKYSFSLIYFLIFQNIFLPIGSIKLSVLFGTFILIIRSLRKEKSYFNNFMNFSSISKIINFFRIYIFSSTIYIFFIVLFFITFKFAFVFLADSVSYLAKIAVFNTLITSSLSSIKSFLIGFGSFSEIRDLISENILDFVPTTVSQETSLKLANTSTAHNLTIELLYVFGILFAPFPFYLMSGPIIPGLMRIKIKDNFFITFAQVSAIIGLPFILTHNSIGSNYFAYSWLLFIIGCNDNKSDFTK